MQETLTTTLTSHILNPVGLMGPLGFLWVMGDGKRKLALGEWMGIIKKFCSIQVGDGKSCGS